MRIARAEFSPVGLPARSEIAALGFVAAGELRTVRPNQHDRATRAESQKLSLYRLGVASAQYKFLDYQCMVHARCPLVFFSSISFAHAALIQCAWGGALRAPPDC